ncbi:MAG: hypothetical protein HOQ28_10900 [Thermoleophilia bacterium]|nr:hypothetical protein [Thermoleophilia bacterium]
MGDRVRHYSHSAQLGLRGSLALGAVGVGSQAFFAFTGRWFLFATSVLLGVGMPVLGLSAPSRWEEAGHAITGQWLDARRVNRRRAAIAATALGGAAAVIFVCALVIG